MPNAALPQIFMFGLFVIKLSYQSPQLYCYFYGIIAVLIENTFLFLFLTLNLKTI